MKFKILGIIACILILLSASSAATSNTNFDDNVPTWNVGDSWTYSIDDFTFDYEYEGQTIFVEGSIEDFTWTVESTEGSIYTVGFTGDISANYDIYLSSSSTTFDVEGTFNPKYVKLTGTIMFTKTDLEIQDVNAEIKGFTKATIAPIPIPLPIPIKVTVDGDLSTIFPLFDFPLSTDKFWTMPNLVATIRINAGGILGFINVPITFTTEYPWIPFAFHCQEKQDVTVEAGTFSAYRIQSLIGDFFDYYYAPTVGNLVKIDANMPNGDVHGELKSTNRL